MGVNKVRFAEIGNKLAGIIRFKKHKALSVVVVVLLSLLIAVCAERMYPILHGLLRSGAGEMHMLPVFSPKYIYRVVMFSCIVFIGLIHFVVDIPAFYKVVFKYRYLIAVTVFLLLVK